MKKRWNKSLLVVFSTFLLCFQSCKDVTPTVQIKKRVLSKNGGVVSAHPEATKIGLDILKQGGNAIDAAIAVHFALSVCYPVAGNVGGGGFMMYRDEKGSLYALDFREKAPIASTENMYLDGQGEVIKGLSTEGVLAVGVPGAVKGMEEAFSKYSALKNWETLLQPSVELAKNGFPLTKKQAHNLNKNVDKFKRQNPQLESPFIPKRPYKEGDLFIQKELALTLETIKSEGAEAFYKGRLAEAFIADIQARGGILSMEDMHSYDAKWRDVISIPYKDFVIHSMPPPSSGGIVLAQLFNAVESHAFTSIHNMQDVQIMVEAEKRAYADRAHFMGDSDFVKIPIETLISKAYMKDRMKDFSFSGASPTEGIEHGTIESEETTHFSIVDQDGRAVSLTTTLNGGYGSKVIATGGYLLNNEMDDFSSKVGHPNLYGLVGAEANKIEPGKRMLSSMTPTIIEKNGALFLVIGTPGGSTIITSVFQASINVMEYKMDLEEAIQSCRFHHQWKPEEVFYEDGCFSDELIMGLTQKGYKTKSRSNIGRMEGILITEEGYELVADKRGDDHAMGY